jgi:hypothetical protein
MAQAQAAPCLVIGDVSAKLSSSEGERSPVFMAPSCDSLRLITGKAQASWIGRDGKPKIVPIAASGPDATPEQGVAERSVYLVWNELTSRREAQRPAFMRALSKEREPLVFVPEDGLLLLSGADTLSEVRIALLKGEDEVQVSSFQVDAGSPVRLDRKMLALGDVYRIQIRRGELTEQWRWRILSQEESEKVQEQLRSIPQAVPDRAQQPLIQAMLYEQFQLRINRALVIQGMH